jgi:hypothetical protein
MSQLKSEPNRSKSKVRLTEKQLEEYKNEYTTDDHLITLHELAER